jgi:hypothetical protein
MTDGRAALATGASLEIDKPLEAQADHVAVTEITVRPATQEL